MKTRDKILTTACLLFNQKGVGQVSAKAIAAHLGMSDGNLRYHFRTKEDIVYHLYLALVNQLDRGFDEQRESARHLSDLFGLLRFTFSLFVEYRFLLLDFTAIMRQYAVIRNHYQELGKLRKQQFQETVDQFIELGLLREDIHSDQYAYLATHFTIISDFWLPHAEMIYQEKAISRLEDFVWLTFSLLFPYLTPAGQEDYKQLQQERPTH